MKSPEQIEIEDKVEELICLVKKLDPLGEQYNYLIAALLFHQAGVLSTVMPELKSYQQS
jgi:hypothetical protein